MTPELEAQLASEYPSLFAGATYPLTESLMAFGCECGDGWFDIINAACRDIDQHCKSTGNREFRFSQIKQKFGTLRMYSYGSDEFINCVIDEAERLSSKTCESCGRPGARNTEGYWIATHCEDCR